MQQRDEDTADFHSDDGGETWERRPVAEIDAATGKVTPGFVPLGDRLLIRRIEAAAVTAGGLHIPDTATEKVNQGEVIAAGRDVEAPELVTGAVVVFGKYAGDEIMLADEVFVVLREVDVFGVATGSAAA